MRRASHGAARAFRAPGRAGRRRRAAFMDDLVYNASRGGRRVAARNDPMFSQTAEYALRAMSFLAGLPPKASANSERISRQMKIPRPYLSKVLRDLVVAGLVSSQRGPNGGFVLTRDPASVSILDVINAVEPLERIHTCPLGNPEHVRLCPLHRRMDAAIARVAEALQASNLAEVALGADAKVLRPTPDDHPGRRRSGRPH